MGIWVEIIGVVATAFVLLSFLFKQTVVIRLVNCAGAAVFIVYGALLHAWAVLGMNAAVIIVHIVYLLHTYRKQKREAAETTRREQDGDQKGWWELYGHESNKT